MAPYYVILGFIVVGLLFWLTRRFSCHHGKPSLLEQENNHLRHVITEMSLEKHRPSLRQ